MPIGTFSYGGKYPKWGIRLPVFCVMLGIFAVTLIVCEWREFADLGVFSCIGLSILFVIGPAVMGMFAILMKCHNERLEQQLQLWLQDAVPTEGYMICIEHGRRARYEITIKYNGEEKTFATPCEQSKEFPLATTWGFALMCDATIPVLYSPKYNQVIFVDLSNCQEIL